MEGDGNEVSRGRERQQQDSRQEGGIRARKEGRSRKRVGLECLAGNH